MDDAALAIKMHGIILTRCTSGFTYEGASYRLVDKPFSDPDLKADIWNRDRW